MEAPTPRPSAIERTAWAALIVAAVWIAFAPALSAGLLTWDDHATLIEVDGYRGLGASQLSWMFTTSHMGPYQPLAWLSYGVDYSLWGLDPRLDAPQAASFHRTSLVLHVLGALAFWRLCVALLARVFRSDAPSQRVLEGVGAFGALVYAAHPLRAESVAWVTERRDVLCALFYCVGALAYVRSTTSDKPVLLSRSSALSAGAAAVGAVFVFLASIDWSVAGRLEFAGLGLPGVALALLLTAVSAAIVARASGRERSAQRWFALSVLAFATALLSKGVAMVLPAVLLVADVWPLRRSRSLGDVARAVAEKAPYLALAAMAARLAMWGQRSLPEAMISIEAHSWSERVLQACYGLCFYPLKTLVPLSLSPIYELPDDVRISDPRFLAAAVAVPIVVTLLVLFRRRWPALTASFAAFALAIAPVLGLTQAGAQLVADRYSVLACMPFALLASGGLAWLLRRTSSSRTSTGRAATIGASVVVVGVLVGLTRAQAAIWVDSSTLWSHALRVRPGDALIYGQLASIEADRGNRAPDAASRRQHFERAVELYATELELDDTPIANDLLNLGSTLLKLDRAREAEPWLRRAVAARPAYHLGYANLGAALAAQGRFDDAAQSLRQALELAPDYARGWHQLGLTLAAKGDRAGAVAALQRCVDLWPSFEPARSKLAELER